MGHVRCVEEETELHFGYTIYLRPQASGLDFVYASSLRLRNANTPDDS